MSVDVAEIAFDALPDDMQLLILQFVEDCGSESDIPPYLPLLMVPVSCLPDVELDDPVLGRGIGYALDIDLDQAPPLVIAHGHLLDGRHRTYRARHSGITELCAIDLTELVNRPRRSIGEISGYEQAYGLGSPKG